MFQPSGPPCCTEAGIAEGFWGCCATPATPCHLIVLGEPEELLVHLPVPSHLYQDTATTEFPARLPPPHFVTAGPRRPIVPRGGEVTNRGLPQGPLHDGQDVVPRVLFGHPAVVQHAQRDPQIPMLACQTRQRQDQHVVRPVPVPLGRHPIHPEREGDH
eukprot:9887532-Lingulodinium_polyedra.AAC.1